MSEEAKRTGIYREDGWVAKVEILEGNSDDEWERYRLKVLETIENYSLFRSPANGTEFTVDKVKDAPAYLCWTLEVAK